MATVTEPQLVSSPNEVIYAARRSDLRLTMKPRYPIRDQVTGQPTGMTPGIYIAFRDGRFAAPKEGKVRLSDTLDGGESDMDAEELHRWLQGHRLFGDAYEGFVVQQRAVPPVSVEEMKRLARAAGDFDVATLEELIRQESEGWQRPEIIETAEESLRNIAAAHAEFEAQKAAEEQAAAEAEKAAAKK